MPATILRARFVLLQLHANTTVWQRQYGPLSMGVWISSNVIILRHGSNERDSSSVTERSSPVMLSAAKHLSA